METVTGFIFLGSKITMDDDCSHEIKRCLLLGRKAITNLDSILKKQRHHFADKGSYSQIYDFSSRELDYKEGWALNNWCFSTVVLKKTLESPLDSKEIKSVNPNGNQPEYSLEGLVLKLSSNTLATWWEKLSHTGKDPDSEKDWGQEEKGATEDEMVGWHHRLSRHEFEQTSGDGNGQRSLVCCKPWGHKESDTTEWLNNSNMKIIETFHLDGFSSAF